jgi:hypothetical protein
MRRPLDLLHEEAALLVEHEALLLNHDRLTAGSPPMEWRAHAHNLIRHRRRLRSFMEALHAWRIARRAV